MLRMIIIIFVINSVAIFSQEKFDSCNCEVQRIISNYKRLEKNYIEKSKEKLLYFINQDSVLKEKFLLGDSINFKSLKSVVSPLLRLDYNARNYKYNENICKYFVFDTLTYDCSITFYLNNKSVFSIHSLPTPCECGVLRPGGLNLSKEEEFIEKSFSQSVYKDTIRNNYFNSFIFQDSSSKYFLFTVDGLEYGGLYLFLIYNSKLYLKNGNFDKTNINEFPTQFIESIFNEKWIRYCARRCSIGGVPWWRFWDWGMFLSKPKGY